MGNIDHFSTVERNLDDFDIVYVNSLNIFRDRTGNVINLENGKHYIYTKTVNHGEFQLKVPDNGSVQFSSLNILANTIETELTGTTPLFIGNIARVDIRDVNIVSLTGGGRCFDLSAGTGVVPILFFLQNRVQNFGALGTLDGINFASENVGWILNKDGFILNNMAIIQMAEQNFAFQGGDHLRINGSINDAFFDTLAANPASGDSVFNIDSGISITTGIQIRNSNFNTSGGGDWFDPAGLDQTDIHVKSFNNVNVADSNTLASAGFTAGTTPTVLSDTSTFIKPAGSYVAGNAERFTESNGVLTYIGLEPTTKKVAVQVALKLEPGIETDVIDVSILKDDNEVAASTVRMILSDVFQTPTAPPIFPQENIFFETGTTVTLGMRNTSKATNITATDAKILVEV